MTGGVPGALTVFLGAGLGGACRYGVGLAAARLLGTGFPFGTLLVNVAGCFAMGLVAAWASRGGLPEPGRLFLATGVLGGFTTFSAFSLDAALLWDGGRAGAAVLYAGSSVVLSFAALALGLALARAAGA